MATARFSFTLGCPMNSRRRCGRSFSSKDESSSNGTAETMRSRSGWEWSEGKDTQGDSKGKTREGANTCPIIIIKIRILSEVRRLCERESKEDRGRDAALTSLVSATYHDFSP